MINGLRTEVVLTFDKALVPNVHATHTVWDIRFNNQDYVPSFAQSAGNTVTLTVTAGLADPGLDRISYAPPPFIVVTLENGRPVVAFTDFPLTA